jgi:transposase
MTTDDFNASFKYSVLEHAYENKNITNTCRIFHLSRTIYYEWLRRFNQFGYLELMDKEKSKPRMPNQVKPDFEQIILNYIVDYPTRGPRRISHELKVQEITISETGVYHVLRRANLNHRLDRLLYAQEHSDNSVITVQYL